jgi:HD-GYP domain-containing protein (c-di-GMP phosphodiesterase class II)
MARDGNAARTTADAARELSALREELEHQRTENAIKERQLDRYAADLRATSRRERQRARELSESYMATVRALSNAVEARDAYTAHHADRVTAYGIELAAASGIELAGDSELECAFLLHDIGKVAIPDGILFKTGTLDEQERAVMQRHPVIGEEIIREIAFLQPARPLVRHHHERWDGAGYPDGLAGAEIPLVARVFALADALDALTSDRPYRAAIAIAEARDVIESSNGQFDPAVLDAFAAIPDERIEEIRGRVPQATSATGR